MDTGTVTSGPAGDQSSGAAAGRYRVRRVGKASAMQMGLALALLVSVLPACLCGAVAVQTVGLLRDTLVALSRMRVTVLGQSLTMDLVDLLHLAALQDTVGDLSAVGAVLAVAVAVLVLLAAALVGVLAALLLAVGYNVLAGLSGGLALELQEVAPPRATDSASELPPPP